MERRLWFIGPLAGLIAIGTAAFATALPAAATPGSLGGMSVAGYCAGLGFVGTTDGNTALLKGGITGTNFAYGNWACVDGAGRTTPVATTGRAPSMTDLCHVQYPGIASYAAPIDANDAYTWNCYSLPPAAGPGAGQQRQAAINALLSTDQVQAEIATLQALGPHPLQVLLRLEQFLTQPSQQELIPDVLGGYGLQRQQGDVTVGLGAAMLRVVLHQP